MGIQPSRFAAGEKTVLSSENGFPIKAFGNDDKQHSGMTKPKNSNYDTAAESVATGDLAMTPACRQAGLSASVLLSV
ncbi:MAG: hypothetical protein V1833_07250 [Elusimicrobiota bacterium]